MVEFNLAKVNLRVKWKHASPRTSTSPGAATALLSGICVGCPVPAACHLSIKIKDHQIRRHSCSSESSSKTSTDVYFHSFIELASATARARRNGNDEEARESASMINNSKVCKWTMLAGCEDVESAFSHSLKRVLANLALPEAGWPTACSAYTKAVLTSAGEWASSVSSRSLVFGRIGYTGWAKARKLCC